MDILTFIAVHLLPVYALVAVATLITNALENRFGRARRNVAAPSSSASALPPPVPPVLPDLEPAPEPAPVPQPEPSTMVPRVWREGDDLSRHPDHRRIRLRTPDFEAVAHELGAPLPRCVRDLYKNAEEVLREDFVVHAPRWRDKTEEWPIRHYAPADPCAAMTWTESNRNLRTFRFAEDPLGNHYVIRLDQEDPPVWVQQRGTGRMTFVCPRFSDFMRAPREPRRIPAPPAPRHEGLPSPMAWMK